MKLNKLLLIAALIGLTGCELSIGTSTYVCTGGSAQERAEFVQSCLSHSKSAISAISEHPPYILHERAVHACVKASVQLFCSAEQEEE